MNDRNPTVYASAAEALRLLVLRGDGLTTTSLEILTRREIGIRLLSQRQVRMTPPASGDSGAARLRRSATPAEDGVPDATAELDLHPGQEVLVRRVSLTDAASTVYAVAEVVAVLDRLPAGVATLLLTTPTPFGKALAADGVAVTRELRRWGAYRAGRFAAMLGPTLDAASVVAGRTYRMVSTETDEPMAVVTEWFAPRLFERATDPALSTVARTDRQPPAAAGDV